jgi:hypothetical protein
VILFALLSSCSSGSAIDVAGKFWGALNDGDLEKAKSYATKETAESLTLNNNGGDSRVDVEFGEETTEGGRTIIETHMVTQMGGHEQAVELKTVLVQEDGKWKVDVMNTMMSMFGGAMEEMMQGMTEAMGQAMEGMGTALMQGMQDGFSQLGGALGAPNSSPMPELEKLTEALDYRIKFGYLKKRADNTYYVSKETTKIPMRTNGFKWGYTIESNGEPFTTYSIAYAPDGAIDGSGYPRTNSQGEQGWESNTTTVTGELFSQAYRNDPGDTRGERKIEIYIEDKLAKTIEFTIGK